MLEILPKASGIRDDEDIHFFQGNMSKYLSKICEIFACTHENNSFHYLVKIKERKMLEEFFHAKKKKKETKKRKNISHEIYNPNANLPAASYLIFSQEVSNCLNSYAKKFNYKYKRKGGLFGDRYSKILIESEEEMVLQIARLNKMEEKVLFTKEWRVKESYNFQNKIGECSSEYYYREDVCGSKHSALKNFLTFQISNLRGIFSALPPAHIKAPDFLLKYANFLEIHNNIPPW